MWRASLCLLTVAACATGTADRPTVPRAVDRAAGASAPPVQGLDPPPLLSGSSTAKQGAAPSAYPRFVQENLGPIHAAIAAPGDGDWSPLTDPRHPQEPAPMSMTRLHPDKKRPWSTVVVVASDLRQTRMHIAIGVHEPPSKPSQAKAHLRPGVIDPALVGSALAAFNGGPPRTQRGYGVKAEGLVLVEPRSRACTIAGYPDDGLRVAGWEALKSTRQEIVWFRQAPPCMVEGGRQNEDLALARGAVWDATADNEAVVRRSALGLSADRRTLYVATSEASTAIAIATAIRHAGASEAATLDVDGPNAAFVTIDASDAANATVKPLIGGPLQGDDDYVRRPMSREFFYLTRKAPDAVSLGT